MYIYYRLPVARRQKGSTYFPASLHGLYQAAQNMNTTHMQSGLCTEMPPEYKQLFVETINTKVSSSVAGRPYWAKTARQLGLLDTEDGIRFIRDLTPTQIAQIRASSSSTTSSSTSRQAATATPAAVAAPPSSSSSLHNTIPATYFQIQEQLRGGPAGDGKFWGSSFAFATVLSTTHWLLSCELFETRRLHHPCRIYQHL